MPTATPKPAATLDGVVDHLPACKDRCVHGCRASPSHAFEASAIHHSDAPRHPIRNGRAMAPDTPITKRVRHMAQGSDRAAPPLWEHVDDWGCLDTLRTFDVPVPMPDTYPERVADDRYNLDRWTRFEGIADRELDATIAALDAGRKSRARAAPDVADLAAMLRGAFPAVTTPPAARKRPPRPRGFATTGDVYEMLTGKRAPRESHGASDWEAVAGQGGIYVGLVWGLALWLFGRESDPLPEHAIGRMLRGVPVRETRAPFSSPVAALFTANRELPSLGGGSLSLEIAQPRRRTWSLPTEMKVHSTHGGTANIRGEQAVNRVLSARGAIHRAGLAAHEEAAVGVLSDRGMLHDERVALLREIHAQANGVDVDCLGMEEVEREQTVWRFGAAAREAEREDIARAQRAGEDVKARLMAWEKQATDHEARLAAAIAATTAARPKLLRAATADVSDGELLSQAKAASKRLATSVRRVTRYHDPLVTHRPSLRAPRPETGDVRLDFAAPPPGLAL